MHAPTHPHARRSASRRALTSALARALARAMALSLTTAALAGVGLTGATATASAQTSASLTVGTAASPDAIPTTDTFVPVSGPVFGDPTAASNEILNRLYDNIAHTPRG